jgi:sporulation protein YlmC with PRC-barrel domain
MRLEFGATVLTADGQEVGAIDQLVVDSERRTIPYFILRTGRLFNHDHIVPTDAIRAVDDGGTIRLVLTAAQVRALPEFEEENFVTGDVAAVEVHQAMPQGDSALLATPAEDAQWRYLLPTGGPGQLLPAGPIGRATSVGRAYEPADDSLLGIHDPTDVRVTTLRSLPEWDYRIGTHTKVVTRDDHTVGSFHEVEMDVDGKPEAIVISSGRFHPSRRAIPIGRVRSADSGQILLDVTREEYERWAAPVGDTPSTS